MTYEQQYIMTRVEIAKDNQIQMWSNTKLVSQYSSEVVYTIVSASPCSPIIMFA